MQINPINNNQIKPNFKAGLKIVGDQTLFSKEQLEYLTKKTSALGNSNDMVLVGVTRCAKRKLNEGEEVSEYDSKYENEGSHTLLGGSCHTFFNLDNPPSFEKGKTSIYGTREERANQCFNFINSFLDRIKIGLEKK